MATNRNVILIQDLSSDDFECLAGKLRVKFPAGGGVTGASNGLILNGSTVELGSGTAPGAALTRDTFIDGVTNLYSFRLNNLDGFSVDTSSTQTYDTAQSFDVNASSDIDLTAGGQGRLVSTGSSIFVQGDTDASFLGDDIVTVGVTSSTANPIQSELRLITPDVEANTSSNGRILVLQDALTGRVEFDPLVLYQQASYAPTVTGDDGLAFTNLTVNHAFYTIVGDLINVSIRVTFDVTTAGGALRFTLPFNADIDGDTIGPAYGTCRDSGTARPVASAVLTQTDIKVSRADPATESFTVGSARQIIVGASYKRV